MINKLFQILLLTISFSSLQANSLIEQSNKEFLFNNEKITLENNIDFYKNQLENVQKEEKKSLGNYIFYKSTVNTLQSIVIKLNDIEKELDGMDDYFYNEEILKSIKEDRKEFLQRKELKLEKLNDLSFYVNTFLYTLLGLISFAYFFRDKK